MICIRMDPPADQQTMKQNQLLFLQSNFDTRFPNDVSEGGAAADNNNYDSNQLGRTNPSSDDSKMIVGWDCMEGTDIVRSSVTLSSCLDDDVLQTNYSQSDLPLPPYIEAPNQCSVRTSVPDDLRSMNSSRSSESIVPPFAASVASTSAIHGSVSSENSLVQSSRYEKRDDGTIRVPSGSGYRIMTPFPWRLHEILEEVEKKKLDHIVSWLPNGQAFQIHCQDSFSDVIIPMFFRHSRYKSFQRQLYLYGFRSIETHSLSRGRLILKAGIDDQNTICIAILESNELFSLRCLLSPSVSEG
jgi:hypothetical protein